MTDSDNSIVAFLLEAARYFENRPTGGEDKAHWANVYNAENCRKAADEIEKLRFLLSIIRERLVAYDMIGAMEILEDHKDD